MPIWSSRRHVCATAKCATKKIEIISEIITLIPPLAQLRPHNCKFLPCAYCFENGGARTATLWSARWFWSDKSVARKIWGRNGKRKATQNTDLGETWRRSRAGVFWCDSEEPPVKVAAVLCSLRSRRNQRVICVYAHRPLKNAVCAPPQDRAGASNRPIRTNILIWICLWVCLPEDGSVSYECVRLKNVHKKPHLFLFNVGIHAVKSANFQREVWDLKDKQT